jgi:hypothetical protein
MSIPRGVDIFEYYHFVVQLHFLHDLHGTLILLQFNNYELIFF